MHLPIAARPLASRWTIFLLWCVATVAGLLLSAIPVLVVQFVLGLDPLDDPQRRAEVTVPLLVLGAVLCGAGTGATMGLLQWLVLRRHVQHAGRWVVATAAGYASLGMLPLLAGPFQPGWPVWAFTLIINDKFHWLARVVNEWPAASWPAGALTLTLFGAVLGIAQWLVLRGRVHRAAWWIPLSAAGWALGAVLSARLFGELAVLLSWRAPLMLTGLAMTWLVWRAPAPR